MNWVCKLTNGYMFIVSANCYYDAYDLAAEKTEELYPKTELHSISYVRLLTSDLNTLLPILNIGESDVVNSIRRQFHLDKNNVPK